MMDILRILIAPLVWLAGFSAVYGLHGALCGPAIAVDALSAQVFVIGTFVITVLLQMALLWVLYHTRFAATSGFVRFVSRATAWVGLTATVWTLFPVAVLPACG